MDSPKIDYVEFQTSALGDSKDFFTRAFGWEYIDYGLNYADIQKAGLSGGLSGDTSEGHVPPLVILKSSNFEDTLKTVTDAGGVITKPIFSFPGGRRFQFKEPGGNELAVWSEK